MHTNLRSFINQLKNEKELIEITAEADPYLEIPEIHRRVIDEQGPALLFTNVKNNDTPVVTNLFGTVRRLDMAFGPKPEAFVKQAIGALDKLMPPTISSLWNEKSLFTDVMKLGTKTVSKAHAPVAGIYSPDVDMRTLPALTGWQHDSGPFVTLPLVYTEHPENNAHNLGMYRIEIREQTPAQTGIHWQIHKGGGFHHYEAEQRNEALPVSLFIGGPPALMISAIAPIPPFVPELMFSSFLMGKKLTMFEVENHPHKLVAEAEFAFAGSVPPHVRKPEGPFGDHYGYYSLEHDFPVLDIKQMWKRKDAIYPATVVGKPYQEDFYIAEYLQRLLRPFYPLVMSGVKDLQAYGETGVHALTGAIVRESYYKEGLTHAIRILGEGQLSLTKFLMVTSKDVDLQQFHELLEAVLERFLPERDLLIMTDTSMDTLDYTGRSLNVGSKAIMTGLGDPIRTLARTYTGGHIDNIRDAIPFCGGCLVVSGPAFSEHEDFAQWLVDHAQEALGDWQLVFLVDDASIAESQNRFLWTTFTRFDPAHDLYAKADIVRNNVRYRGPIVIDSRMKPFYPEEVVVDEEVAQKVDARWKDYFPRGY
ncbi:UbiD family decarboxylase [Shouchella shacheensis]|uniref:UbiD family decarboxylase n=1 Tax=Shouchella shacheensis TaxID=1649580 RepID=UPI00073FF1BF|nr:UbiD family decarboxylase [Shouchella shacheensis]